MLCYSQEYSTDKATMIAQDFDLDERTRLFVQEHINFFGSAGSHETVLRSGYACLYGRNLCAGHDGGAVQVPAKPEELVRHVLRGALDAGNESLQLFEKFGLATDFWLVCKRLFGYNPAGKNLKDLGHLPICHLCCPRNGH